MQSYCGLLLFDEPWLEFLEGRGCGGELHLCCLSKLPSRVSWRERTGNLVPSDPLPLKLGSRDWALGIWCISVIEDGGLSQVRLRQSCLSSMEPESPLCLPLVTPSFSLPLQVCSYSLVVTFVLQFKVDFSFWRFYSSVFWATTYNRHLMGISKTFLSPAVCPFC